MPAVAAGRKPHAVCIPFPAQGHISPMLTLAKLLHHKGFHITFVHTEFNYSRLLKSGGPKSLQGLPDFRFATIPDGLPPPENPDEDDPTRNIIELCFSTRKNCLVPFRNLLNKLNNSNNDGDVSPPPPPPVSCIVADGIMSFTLEAAEELGIPNVLLWTVSAHSFMCYLHYPQLLQGGFIPLKDASYLTNGHLDTIIDWIPGIKSLRLKDIPVTVWVTDPDDPLYELALHEISGAHRASAIILNTFHALEPNVLNSLSSMLDRIYAVGPLQLLLKQVSGDHKTKTITSTLWKEDPGCIEWLDSTRPGSVIYVNFGSVAVLTPHQLAELAWGLSNSMQNFLWIIRPNLARGDPMVLTPEFYAETKDKCFIASWCDQGQVLNHPSIGGFLTHCGWNSNLESLCAGVPMICWPFFADQQTNCSCSCTHWGVGVEIEGGVERGEVERVVRDVMEGERGKKMKKRAWEWKKKAEEEVGSPNWEGSCFSNLDTLIEEVLMCPEKKSIM